MAMKYDSDIERFDCQFVKSLPVKNVTTLLVKNVKSNSAAGIQIHDL